VDNFKPNTQAPEKEHSLPDTFIEKREEFYANKSNISKARIIRDERMLKEAVIAYMTTLDYICNRIKPKVRGKYLKEIQEIQAYMITCLQDVGSSDTIPDEVIQMLDHSHEVVSESMVKYGFDQITPTVLNI